MRLALGIEYSGACYQGWQRQPNGPSVQQTLEAALERIADAPMTVICAGRTDAGVHATGQVIHFDSPVQRRLEAWLYGTNHHLPKDITVRWVREVSEDFHARYSATARRYRYILFNHPIRPAIGYEQLAWHYRPLNIAAMQQAASCLLGEHDFASFRAAGCQSHSTWRNIHHLSVSSVQRYIVFDITANAFLYRMVRNIVGALMRVGEGAESPSWIKELLTARDHRVLTHRAPASGLYLVQVDYPASFALPKVPPGPWWLADDHSKE